MSRADDEKAAHALGPNYGEFVDRVHFVTRIRALIKARWFIIGFTAGVLMCIAIWTIKDVAS